MNRYHMLGLASATCNVILGSCFIFLIDELRMNDLMLQYFLLYLLTMAITICLHKIGNVYDFNCKYGDYK